MKRQRVNLTDVEKKFIQDNSSIMTIKEIADKLNRQHCTTRNFCISNNISIIKPNNIPIPAPKQIPAPILPIINLPNRNPNPNPIAIPIGKQIAILFFGGSKSYSIFFSSFISLLSILNTSNILILYHILFNKLSISSKEPLYLGF